MRGVGWKQVDVPMSLDTDYDLNRVKTPGVTKTSVCGPGETNDHMDPSDTMDPKGLPKTRYLNGIMLLGKLPQRPHL